MDSTVYEFGISVPDDPYVTPLTDGHHFLYYNEAKQTVPGGDDLMRQMLDAASKESGLDLMAASPWWVVTLNKSIAHPLSTVPTLLPTMGDHQEGNSDDDWTLLVALNDLPDDAEGEFRLVESWNGPVVGKLYPHKKGRGLMFKSRHWHGNAPLAYDTDRVSLAFLAKERDNESN